VSLNTEKVISHIVNWLTDYCKNSGTKGFIIGISGGIDSAITSTLAAKTGLKVICLEMPIHQDQKQVQRAENHISFLKSNFSNVSSIKTDLTPVFDGFTYSVQAKNETELEKLALANTRSRMRMTTLYYYAQLNQCLVLGTGNKIEDFGVGFFTKYGDGGVDLSPIADLTKSEVYQIGKELNIINEIIVAPPTDGLFGDERTDEDQIGATYPELEWAMQLTEKNSIIDKKKFSKREVEVFEIYSRLNRINQHKMIPIPVCVIPKELK
jgi:NAD+ synthase